MLGRSGQFAVRLRLISNQTQYLIAAILSWFPPESSLALGGAANLTVMYWMYKPD